MDKEFQTLFNYAGRLRSRYLNTLAASKIFERFNELAAPNRVGKRKAEKSVKIFNSFKYFFLTIKESARCYLLIELAKFFDEHKKSLTLHQVLNYARKNVSKFTKKDFLAYHKDRKILPELFASYKQLSLADLRKIQKRLDKNKVLIKNLIIYRNQYLAHDDIQKIPIRINAKDTRILLNIVKSTIALLYNKLDFSSNSYVNFEEQPIEDLNGVMGNLIKCEQQRIEEIRREYRIRK